MINTIAMSESSESISRSELSSILGVLERIDESLRVSNQKILDQGESIFKVVEESSKKFNSEQCEVGVT